MTTDKASVDASKLREGVSPTLIENARKLILEVKAQHLLGERVSDDRLLAFAFADALLSTLTRKDQSNG